MKFDVEKFVAGLHEYFAKELTPVLARLKSLESRQLEKGEKGEKGDQGEQSERGEIGAQGEKGEQGDQGFPGGDGEKGDPGENGKDGENGVDGKDGETGEAGEKGGTGKDGKDGVEGEAGETGEAGEKGEQGEAGIKGEQGEQGEKSEPGERGEKGETGAEGVDGKSISEEDVEKIVQRQVSVWVLDFERRAMEVLQKALDKISTPKDGVDGKDGLGFDDLSVVQLDDKRLKFIMEAGGRKKEFIIKLPIIVDAGVYKNGMDYVKGDGVTYGGSFWIAQVDHPNQSPGKGAEWRLAVKRGKDAKEVQL